jgi:hypothetical protein
VAAHVDERLHEHDEEGVHTEWERQQVVLPSRGGAAHEGPDNEGPTGRRRHQEGGSRVDAAAADVCRPCRAHRSHENASRRK